MFVRFLITPTKRMGKKREAIMIRLFSSSNSSLKTENSFKILYMNQLKNEEYVFFLVLWVAMKRTNDGKEF